MLTLFLSVTTFLSLGTGRLVQGQAVEQIKAKADEVIQIAQNDYNSNHQHYLDSWNGLRFNNDLQMLILNSSLRSRFIDGNLKSGLSSYASEVFDDEHFETDFSLEDAYGGELFDYGIIDNSPADRFLSEFITTTRTEEVDEIDNFTILLEDISTEGTSLEKIDDQAGEVQVDPEPDIVQLPLIENHDNSYLSAKINASIDNHLFLGFEFDADTCISIYNIISNWLNNKVMLDGMNSSLSYALESLCFVLSNSAYTSSIYDIVLSIFTNCWSQLVAFFTPTGAFGIIFATILCVVAICTIVLVVLLYIAGSHHKGYRIGYLYHSLFNWEWLNGEY